MKRHVRACVAWGVLVGACTVGDLDLSGKGCPCVGGYVCDATRNVCVALREGGVDGGAEATLGDASAPFETSLPCPSVDATLADDPHNCGRCGHDCLGGACSAGACQPVLLFGALAGPIEGLTTDGTNLYWGAGSIVYYGSTGGGSAQILFGRGTGDPVVGVAVDTSSVYWTSRTGLYSCAKPPMACSSPTPFSPSAYTLALDPTNVYWSTPMADGGIFECTKASACDGGPQPIAPVYTTTLVASSGHVLWTTQGGLYDDLDGSIATLQPNGSNADKAAAYGTLLYWSNTFSPGSTLLGCVLGACDAGPIGVTEAGAIESLTADSTGAYFADSAGSIWSYSASTGQVELASHTRALAVTVDPTALYFSDFVSNGVGRIMKLARP